MGDEPCDVGPVWSEVDGVWEADLPVIRHAYRHHPAGTEPPDAERDQRAQRRAAERNLMDFCGRLPTYILACDAMKPAKAPDYTDVGETFARLIGSVK